VLKNEELANPASCINKAAPDEPVFVLRGKDICSAFAVRQWANVAEAGGHHEPEKIAHARQWADKMEAYSRSVAPRTLAG
jgi:hypothetical protein